MKIITIARNPDYSPNMATNDAAILESVTEELVRMGFIVTGIEEGTSIPEGTDVICHMARGEKALQQIENAEKDNVIAINPTNAVRHCSRIEFMRTLNDCGIMQPNFRIIENSSELEELEYPAWIKRADGWSCHKEDVCYAETLAEATAAMYGMKERGIGRCIYSKHINGDVIKFYGIGSKFFHCCYPNTGNTKFGLERFNGNPSYYSFNMDEMKSIADKAATKLGLLIFGGDCIVTEEGEILLIDINDFPSFSAIRKEAAREIARLITETAKDKNRYEKRG